MYIHYFILFLECFAFHITLGDVLRSARKQLSGGLKNTGTAVQNIPSLVGGGAKNTANTASGLLQGGLKNTKNALSLIAGGAKNTKNAAGAIVNGAVKCIGASCKFAIKIGTDKRTILTLAALAGTLKLAGNQIENKGAQMAAQSAIKDWLYFLPQVQASSEVRVYLQDMAKDLIRLMCRYKNSGDKQKIAIANLFQSKIAANPEVNKIVLSASVGVACLAARLPF